MINPLLTIQGLQPQETTSYWTYIFDFSNLLVGVLTLILGFVIYKRFSFKNKVKEKQFEEVCELINVLKGYLLRLEYTYKLVDSNKDISYATIPTYFKFFEMKNIFNKHKKIDSFNSEAELLITDKYLKENPLTGLDFNPFMPDEIADKIKPFSNGIYGEKKILDYSNIVILCNDVEELKEDKNEYNLYVEFHGGKLSTFKSYYNACVELDDAIKDWLKNNGADKLNLR